MPKVLISDKMAPLAAKVFEKYPSIELTIKTGMTPEQLAAEIGPYEGLVIRSATKVTPEVLAAAKNLKIIARAGSGVDNVDRPAANEHGVFITNTPGGNTVTTAEHAISMMMSLSRHIPQATASLKAGKWEKSKFEGREIFCKTLGIIGLGNIGKLVAERALGLKMKVIAHDKYVDPTVAAELGVTLVSLDELLAASDYITIHLNKSKETANLLDAAALAKTKKGVYLINCSRGGIVNEDALCDALTNGHIAGAALDVFDVEPPPADHKLIALPNVICTPHLGASTVEAQDNVAIAAAEQVADFLVKGELRNCLNQNEVKK